MFSGLISNYISVADNNIPITTVLTTNDKISYNGNNNTIEYNKCGYYDIDVVMNVTGVAGSPIAQIYADGVAVPGAYAQGTLDETSDYLNLSITDAIRVTKDTYPNVANISVRLNLSGLTVNGTVISKYVR